MNEKIIIVYIGDVEKCPPLLSLLNILKDLKKQTVLITVKFDNKYRKKLPRDLEVITICDEYNNNINRFRKLLRMWSIRKKIWSKLNSINEKRIFIISDITLKHVGKKIINEKYFLYFLEMPQNLYYFYKLRFIKLDEKKYCDNSVRVIVPEYNRAHILKALWDLKEVPLVLPNKPYNKIRWQKNMVITHSKEAETLLKGELKNKKIILYQGIINDERPLTNYIDAIKMLDNEYAFVIMTNGENQFQNTKNVFYIPFISPPYHLEVTSHAYIGILSYKPTKGMYSPLNSIYCAPNKIYEYANFSIPMLGNDIPGIRNIFTQYGIGEVLDIEDSYEIVKKIKMIEKNYQFYSNNSKKFYNSANNYKIVKKILEKNGERID
ncbi:Uncharacterised protein [Eubacterium limosum]|uniref:Uncharacterized protein n=1 Tax=Eubacterium limosum TaxID=1736 RepID=A0A6N3GQ56_EUBLI